jgi:hypothetical protein
MGTAQPVLLAEVDCNEVISAESASVGLFEFGEHPCGGNDVADPGLGVMRCRARQRVVSKAKTAFTEDTLATLKRVVGQVIDRRGCRWQLERTGSSAE